MNAVTVNPDLPIACSLTEEQKAERRVTIQDLLGLALVTELCDGYTFRLPDGSNLHEVLEWIMAERECCRFFTFELGFSPDLGPVALTIRGPEGVKEFLAPVLPK